LVKKKLTFATAKPSAVVVVLKGKKRAAVNPGLSEKASNLIDRYEASGQRAEQRLGMIRLR
jgi:hypothetical protein